jgi:trigger factor
MDEPVIDELNGTHCKISFSVSKNEITVALENQHQQLIKEASIPGFRKGKAPPRLVTRLVSPEQRDQLLSRLLLKTFLSATKILGVNPATPPAIRAKIQIASQPSNDSADFEATFEVFKELGALQLGDIEVEALEITVSEDDIDQMLESIRQMYPDWIAVNRPAQPGDRVLFDLRTSGRGLPTREMQAIPWIVGIKNDAPDIDLEVQARCASIVEAATAVGQTSTFEIRFPMNHGSKLLAGHNVRFEVRIVEIGEARRATLSDALIIEHFPEESGIESFRQTLSETLWRDAYAQTRQQLKASCLRQLIQNNPLEIPPSRLDSEIAQIRAQHANSGVPLGSSTLDDQTLQAIARERITLGYLLAKIAKENELKVSPELIDGVVDQVAKSYENAEEVRQWYYDHPEMLESLESSLLEDLVLDWLLTKIKITRKKVSARTLIKDFEKVARQCQEGGPTVPEQ